MNDQTNSNLTPKRDPVLDVPSNFREDDEYKQLADSSDVDKLRDILDEDETVFRLVLCFRDTREAVLAATSKRVIFTDNRFLSTDVESYTYSEIAAVVYRNDLVTLSLTLAHPDRPLAVEKIDKEHGQRFIEFVQRSIGSDYEVGEDGRVFLQKDELLEPVD